MSPPVDRLYELARATLDAVVTYWPADHTELPARRYVTVGAPAADDAQLVVSVVRTIGTGQGNVGRQGIDPSNEGLVGMRTVVLLVQVLRPVPTVESEGMPGNERIPTPAEIEGAAAVMLGDAQAVLNCLIEAQDAKQLAGWGNLAFETWDAVDAAGGLSGGQQRVRLGAW